MRTPASRSPARLARYFFSRLGIFLIFACLRAELVSERSFCGDEAMDGFELAAGVEYERRTTGKQRLGMVLADNRPAMWDSNLPWGRGKRMHMPVEGRSRRSDTV
jgi:hypothetical protein